MNTQPNEATIIRQHEAARYLINALKPAMDNLFKTCDPTDDEFKIDVVANYYAIKNLLYPSDPELDMENVENINLKLTEGL
jgi:hypothetical protein